MTRKRLPVLLLLFVFVCIIASISRAFIVTEQRYRTRQQLVGAEESIFRKPPDIASRDVITLLCPCRFLFKDSPQHC